MAEGPYVRLEIALSCGGDTITGTVDDHANQALQFRGWLELMSALDTVCAQASGPPQGLTNPKARDGR